MARRTITQRYSIKCLSPIFIRGDEDSLLPINYAILDGICYVVDIEKLLTEKKELLIDFRSKIGQLRDKFELTNFLKKHKLLTTEFLEDISVYHSKINKDMDDYSIIYPIKKNAFHEPYIPSTTVRHSLEISLLADRIKRYSTSPSKVFLSRRKSNAYKKYKRKMMGQIDRILNKIKRGKIEKWKDLDKIFFKQFPIKEEDNILHNKKKNQRDIFRSIFITDTLRAGEPVVYPTKLVEKKDKKLEFLSEDATYREFIDVKKEIEIRLTFDIELWRKFSDSKERLKIPFSNLGELFNKADEFYRNLWESEKKYWEQIRKKRKNTEQTLASLSELQKLVDKDFFEPSEDDIDFSMIKEFYAQKPDSKAILLYLGGSKEQENLIIRTALQLTRNKKTRIRDVIVNGNKIIAPTGWVLLYRE